MNTGTILIAEDDPLDAKLMLGALSVEMASRVLLVNDGEEVLDYLYCRGRYQEREAGNPLVLLLDLKMPKVDGASALEIIKGDPRLKTTPVIILTSSREATDLTRCYEGGVNAYVVKPVDFDEFASTVRKLGDFWGAINEPLPSNP